MAEIRVKFSPASVGLVWETIMTYNIGRFLEERRRWFSSHRSYKAVCLALPFVCAFLLFVCWTEVNNAYKGVHFTQFDVGLGLGTAVILMVYRMCYRAAWQQVYKARIQFNNELLESRLRSSPRSFGS